MLENEENIINTEENVDALIDDIVNPKEVDDSPKKKKKDKKDKKGKSKVKKILDWVITGVFGTLIAISAAVLIYSRVGGDGFIGNYLFPQVLTDSMGDVYPVGSVLIVEKVNPADIKIGDNVTFMYDFNPSDSVGKIRVTHQISNITIDDSWEEGKGHYIFTAHGTNKQSEFCKIGSKEYGDCTYQTQTFREMDLVGRVNRVSPVLTAVTKFVKQPIGLISLVLVPCLYLMVTSVIDLFKKIPDDEPTNSTVNPNSGGTAEYKPKVYAPGEDPLAGMSQEDKERLKKELLDQMLGKGGKK
ncbi:MAG: hypothetical protein K6F59_04685 [Gammaproteobacteria bacterium]|nr:hypothetical protein [Gammaproteobacteria bacterium]